MIVVEKSKRLLTLYDASGNAVHTFSVSLGKSPVGAKKREGDNKTPEGEYRICTVNRESKFHLAFGLNYPNTFDALSALREKRISPVSAFMIVLLNLFRLRPSWKTPLGGYIMLHGESPEGLTGDWTAGCIAMKNSDIDLLAGHIGKGEKVKISE